LVAAFAVAYGLGAFTPLAPAKVAETSAPAENSMTAKQDRMPAAAQQPGAAPAPGQPAAMGAGKAPAGSAPATNGATKESASLAGDAASGEKAASATGDAKPGDVTAPSFDVVRVEGNGSIVIAGRSAPTAKVEILSGKNVLGAAAAGAEGDFAIVLDNPLKPGDYQLVLRSTTPANVVAMSKQTAVVSIPEHENGQVLALVESPGQPSKLITVPKPGNAEAPAPAVPNGTQPASSGGGTQMASQDGSKAGTGGAVAASGSPAQTAGQPAGGTGTPSSAGKGDKNGQEAASNDGAPSKPVASAGQAQPSPAAQADAGQSPAQPQISVEAVEIEGNKIFVAGIADPGSTVRVYANDAVLGEAKTSPVGRFLVESIHELAVGDYIIRADMLAADGLKVAARAAVPFTRAPGESVAAVASGEAGSSTTAKDAARAPDSGGAATAANTGSQGTKAPDAGANSMAASSGNSLSGSAASGNAAPKTQQEPGMPQAVASNGQGTAVPSAGDGDGTKQPPTVISPKLQETSGAVIIRRGDTLWQISRRVYGHGVRYSTIYLANQDQIEDPDLIWPGQIFAVPHATKEGETANMKAIASQTTEMPKKVE
jgi:nucleoid-associated protein YgaU